MQLVFKGALQNVQVYFALVYLNTMMCTGSLAIAVQASTNGDEAGRYAYNFVHLFCQHQYFSQQDAKPIEIT